jgi:hypothetical protein
MANECMDKRKTIQIAQKVEGSRTYLIHAKSIRSFYMIYSPSYTQFQHLQICWDLCINHLLSWDVQPAMIKSKPWVVWTAHQEPNKKPNEQ